MNTDPRPVPCKRKWWYNLPRIAVIKWKKGKKNNPIFAFISFHWQYAVRPVASIWLLARVFKFIGSVLHLITVRDLIFCIWSFLICGFNKKLPCSAVVHICLLHTPCISQGMAGELHWTNIGSGKSPSLWKKWQQRPKHWAIFMLCIRINRYNSMYTMYTNTMISTTSTL